MPSDDAKPSPPGSEPNKTEKDELLAFFKECALKFSKRKQQDKERQKQMREQIDRAATLDEVNQILAQSLAEYPLTKEEIKTSELIAHAERCAEMGRDDIAWNLLNEAFRRTPGYVLPKHLQKQLPGLPDGVDLREEQNDALATSEFNKKTRPDTLLDKLETKRQQIEFIAMLKLEGMDEKLSKILRSKKVSTRTEIEGSKKERDIER